LPTADDLRAAVDRKVVYGALGLGLGALFGARVGGAAWLALPVGAVVGYFLPDILAYNRGLKRTEEIQLGLPDALDLLDLCVESGLSLQASLARVAEHQTGPVAAEFGRVLHEMQLGLSRADAFEALARRTKQEDMHRFVAAILQADKLGVPIAAVLKEQAIEMRKKRQARAREQAQKVPVKILGPLLVCFLPGLFVIILGPAIITVADIFIRG
jgi:tight adherence protein C